MPWPAGYNVSMHKTSSPAISVVCATYNRTDVLRHAIASVQSSTLSDWELIVVGDACTDDTAEVVASFADARIRFFNLERNCGEQSGPNNFGCRQARGRYVAFLNNDDLYFSDHLQRALRQLESSGADLVFSSLVVAEEDAAGQLNFRLVAPWIPSRRFHPMHYVPASAWVFSRALFERVGGWRPARELDIEPSQDFLFRAWRLGCELRLLPGLTVLAVPSGGRQGCYSTRSALHDRLVAAMTDEDAFRARILEQLALAMPSPWARFKGLLRHGLGHSLGTLLYQRGIHPKACLYRLRFGERGAFLRSLRRTRGQPAESPATGQEGRVERWLRRLRQ